MTFLMKSVRPAGKPRRAHTSHQSGLLKLTFRASTSSISWRRRNPQAFGRLMTKISFDRQRLPCRRTVTRSGRRRRINDCSNWRRAHGRHEAVADPTHHSASSRTGSPVSFDEQGMALAGRSRRCAGARLARCPVARRSWAAGALPLTPKLS